MIFDVFKSIRKVWIQVAAGTESEQQELVDKSTADELHLLFPDAEGGSDGAKKRQNVGYNVWNVH